MRNVADYKNAYSQIETMQLIANPTQILDFKDWFARHKLMLLHVLHATQYLIAHYI